MALNEFVQTALDEEGYEEGSDGYTKYGSWYGLANADWCVMFISWCANQAGIMTTSSTGTVPNVPKMASTSAMYTWYTNNRRNLAPLEMSRNVQSGNTQNLKSSAASDQAAVCACARSRYFAGGSPSGLRV
jgi:hypothetical protein